MWGNIEDLPANFICGNNDHKILVCRVRERPNRPTRYRTRCVRKGRVKRVLAKGGYLGPCEAVSCGSGQGFIVMEENEIIQGKTISNPTPIIDFQNEVTLFPNPAVNEVSIFIKKSVDQAAFGMISIVSPEGQIVKEIHNANIEEKIQLNLTDFKIGVYFVIVKFENQKPITQRLVIMK